MWKWKFSCGITFASGITTKRMTMERMHLMFAAFLLLLITMAFSGCVEKMPREIAGTDSEKRTKFHIASPVDMKSQSLSKIRFETNSGKCDLCKEQTNARLSQKWNSDLALCGGTSLCEVSDELDR